MFAVTILGNNSAVPAFDRHPTSQVVTYQGNHYLVDCGEGTQIQLIRYKIRRSRITHIFISHLHGDHYFGLAGLINTLSLLNHRQELHVFGPAPLREIIEMQLTVADARMCYPLYLHHINGPGILFENEFLRVSCFRTLHRIECYGFCFEEKKPPRKLISEKLQQYNLPFSAYEKLKQGLDFQMEDGTIIKNEWVTRPSAPPRKYAYCADTKYDESLIPHIRHADLVYHEATYLDNFREVAESRFHSTARQAAELAKKAEVKKLLIGHFSSKYDSLEAFESEAREVFPNTELALEGVCYLI
ncbi:MAG: ribonuclease Z [Chitinophagaceae bacterium]|nr:ribonuclease Z [Chitinophagaceae bacterium]